MHTFHTMFFQFAFRKFLSRALEVDVSQLHFIISHEGDHAEIIKLSLEDKFGKIEANDCG